MIHNNIFFIYMKLLQQFNIKKFANKKVDSTKTTTLNTKTTVAVSKGESLIIYPCCHHKTLSRGGRSSTI